LELLSLLVLLPEFGAEWVTAVEIASLLSNEFSPAVILFDAR
jgi:hypothetical protein